MFRLRAYFGLGIFFIFIIVFIAQAIFAVSAAMGYATPGFIIALAFVLLWLLAVFGVGEIYARMAYNRWMYEFTPTELKIEKGIIWKNYKSIPYNRVQNVEIHRGILARIIGFSTLDIQTAGYSGGYHRGGRYGGHMPRAEGHIPAVSPEAAEKIREFLMKKIRKRSGSGL